MFYLGNILDAVKADVKSQIVTNFAKQHPSLLSKEINQKMINETDGFTEAVIETVKKDTFLPLKVFLSWMCKIYMEEGIRLSEIMAFFDLYEQSLKDVMSAFLKDDLISLNQHRRDFDTMLDKARVYVSEYFFVLYENVVIKQFNQLHIINEISSQLTSSLHLEEVLNFIITNITTLYKVDCSSILLKDNLEKFSAKFSNGWAATVSPNRIVQQIPLVKKVIILNFDETQGMLNKYLKQEKLYTIVTVKLEFRDRNIGVVVLGFRNLRKFTPTDEKILEIFANQAAIAVHNAQIYGETDDKLQQRIREITILLEKNRALLHSLREGVIAIGADELVNLINPEAQRLLNLHTDLTGKKISQFIPNAKLPTIVKTKSAEYDQEEQVGGKCFIINRVPVVVNNQVIGAIATFRDKQDIKELAEELIGVRSLLESMRAQSHEFLNKLHAIAGLIEMKEYDKVVDLITDLSKNRQDCISFIVKRIKDQTTAGLLLGKMSQAVERGVILRLKPRSKLIALPSGFGGLSMVTVMGNLISNAIDAVANMPQSRRMIEVYIFQGVSHLTLSVSDQGCGIPGKYINDIFRRGFSTKQGSRGIGLALVKQEVEMNHGHIRVYSDSQGSRFLIKIPFCKKSEKEVLS